MIMYSESIVIAAQVSAFIVGVFIGKRVAEMTREDYMVFINKIFNFYHTLRKK